ncbi:MAG: serine hydrolase [Pseudomonadota bacterium]
MTPVLAELSALPNAARDVVESASRQGMRWAVIAWERGAQSGFHIVGDGPPGPQAHLRLASLSKLVIGLIHADLKAQGTLSDETRAADLLPEYANALANVTLGDLAAHGTGFRDALHDPRFRAEVNADIDAPQDIARVIDASLALSHATTVPSYANINAILLSLCIERATGRTFAVLAAERLPRLTTLAFPTDGHLPTPRWRGNRLGLAPGRVEYGSTLFDATDHSAAWAGHAGTGVLAAGETPLFYKDVLQPLIALTPRPVGAAQSWANLLCFDGSVAFHDGDVTGYSAWTGMDLESGAALFVAVGLSWSPELGNPAGAIARATLAQL